MRLFIAALLLVAAIAVFTTQSQSELVWGKYGAWPGAIARPRAAAIIGDTLYLVDFTARIQAYDLNGNHTGLTFTTPDYRNGRPSGLGVDQSGRLIVCDSHYHCVRIYDNQGREQRCLTGDFGYVSDCVQDSEGFFYVSEFGSRDRITKLDESGKVVARWGESGAQPGQLLRARALALGPDQSLYVADACNHRIQVFSRDGGLIKIIGSPGNQLGELNYPYDLAFAPDGTLYVAERGNCRIQKFDREGRAVAVWGTNGRGPGQLNDPWALTIDAQGRVHVVDTENHRIQRIKF